MREIEMREVGDTQPHMAVVRSILHYVHREIVSCYGPHIVSRATLPNPPVRSVRVRNYTQYSDRPLECVIKEHGTKIFNVHRM